MIFVVFFRCVPKLNAEAAKMAEFKMPGKVRIVYFTGTGCTRMAARQLEAALIRRGVPVRLEEMTSEQQEVSEQAELLILMYPVYAFNAPKPIDRFIKSRPRVGQSPAAVISVSGGGEVASNKASRCGTIRRLRNKGYAVVYEDMLVMPANCIEATPLPMAQLLLRALPEKTERIAGELIAGTIRRTKPGPVNRLVAALMNFEKLGATMLGLHMRVADICTGCAVCALGCPTGNIAMKNGRPVFSKKCVSCLRCVYACPVGALSSRGGKFLILKDGFSLKSIADTLENSREMAESACGVLWKGIKTYLEEP
jgi:ferredoxin